MLARSVSVEARLTENGVELNTNARMLVALDRLGGSAIDIVGAYVERINVGIRSKTDTKKKLLKVDSDAAVRRLENSPWAGDRVLETFYKERVIKQKNRDAVAMEAVERLTDNPPTDEENADKEPLSDDWMNVFADYAENASSDSLQQLWGRILAGEIRRPGSFSLTTLRVISELDKEIAQKFEKYVRARGAGHSIATSPEGLAGETLQELTFLQEVGLLSGVGGMIGKDLSPHPDGNFYLRDGGFILRITPKPKTTKIRIPIIFLTRVGREIADTLIPNCSQSYLEEVASVMNASKFEQIELGKFAPVGNSSEIRIFDFNRIR